MPADHRLADAAGITVADLREQPWILSPGSALGRLTGTLGAAAGFEPRVAATAEDVATALGLVAIGWGVTISPQLGSSGPGAALVRLPLDGVETVRHRILVGRDGEHLSPGIAAVVAAVQDANRSVDRAGATVAGPPPR